MRFPWRARSADDPYWDFFLNSPPGDDRNSLITALRNAPEGAVNPVKDDIHTPEVMSRHVKELACFLGADAVGITTTEHVGHPFAILCATRAPRDPRRAPGIGGQLPLQRALYVTFILSAWIRELGYQGTTKIPVDDEELALKAGLGRRGPDGRLVNDRLGALAVAGAILTDLPLRTDR